VQRGGDEINGYSGIEWLAPSAHRMNIVHFIHHYSPQCEILILDCALYGTNIKGMNGVRSVKVEQKMHNEAVKTLQGYG